MANLAIKGHKDRGEEVIALLETLGGSNAYRYIGNNLCAVYYIDEKYKNHIICSDAKKVCDCIIFNLEEFLEKFPYKVGDKVSSKYLKNYKIEKMEWEDTNNRVIYKLQGMGWYSADELQPYKKETMEKEISGSIIDRFICLEGFEFYDDKGNIINTKEITMKKKTQKYPKTYIECAKILDCFSASHIDGYKNELIEKFQELLICRDAYWKIAGEQMGLGKPWKPDWESGLNKFCLIFCENRIAKSSLANAILAFPTKEMRDAFYENFKELIEFIKELL